MLRPWGRTESDRTEAEQQYLFKKRKVRTVLDTRALHGPLSNTSGCADPLETPTDHPGLCPLKSRKPGPLGSVLLSGLSSSLTTSEPSSPVTAQARLAAFLHLFSITAVIFIHFHSQS